MNDQEIYVLASKIIEEIKDDFNRAYYDHIGGQLVVSWSAKFRFNAFACSDGDLKAPPNHKINLDYELARIIYRDGEKFYDFISGPIEKYRNFFESYDDPNPPDGFKFHEKKHFLNNFLAAALTYIFAHEIGHLVEEHGHVRGKYGNVCSDFALVDECEAADQNANLNARQSAIWHATELAADYEATYWCITEIFRHALKGPESERSDILLETAKIFISAFACTYFRFNGLTAREPPIRPVGSHPHPVFRLEVALLHAIELIDQLNGVVNTGKTKREISHYLKKSATAANLFWISQYLQPEVVDSALIIGGVINHENTRTYLPELLAAWDGMSEYIKSIKRYVLVVGAGGKGGSHGVDLGHMRFGENFRKLSL